MVNCLLDLPSMGRISGGAIASAVWVAGSVVVAWSMGRISQGLVDSVMSVRRSVRVAGSMRRISWVAVAVVIVDRLFVVVGRLVVVRRGVVGRLVMIVSSWGRLTGFFTTVTWSSQRRQCDFLAHLRNLKLLIEKKKSGQNNLSPSSSLWQESCRKQHPRDGQRRQERGEKHKTSW